MKRISRNMAALAAAVIATLILSIPAAAQDIEWRIYLKTALNDGPILTRTTREGQTFVFDESDCVNVPSESGDIVGALDGVMFSVQQKPVADPLAIHIILNVDGNRFEPAGTVTPFLNMTLSGYVNGNRDDFIEFDRAPVVMTIPQTGLNSLLTLCAQAGSDLVCVYQSGSGFTIEGIETLNTTTGMTVKMTRLKKTVGGPGEEFGVTSGVKVDTWNKIKLLFR